MEEVKLVLILIKSLLLQIVLIVPRILILILGLIESLFRVLKNTTISLVEGLKKEILTK